MRIVLIGINYAPEVVGIGPYTTDLAEHLASGGHDVTVLTSFPYYPHWRTDPAFDRKGPFLVQRIKGVRVIRCPFLLPNARHSAIRQIAFDTSFAASSLLSSVTLGRIDSVISVSPPLQLGLTGWIIARLRGARLILHLQDLVPDAALAVGMMADGVAMRTARWLERVVYARADAITVISEGFHRNLIEKGVPASKVRLLPNWIQTSRFKVERDLAQRAAFGASNGETLVIHAGNMGAKQGLATVVDAAAELVGKNVVLALIGDGNQRSALQARARELGLTNLRFIPLQLNFPATLAAADLVLLVQQPTVVDSVAPSKLLAYMAAAKPVIAAVNAESEAARLVVKSGCGVVVPPGDPRALADAVRELASQPSLVASFGSAGREYATHHYERDALLGTWDAVIAGRSGGDGDDA